MLVLMIIIRLEMLMFNFRWNEVVPRLVTSFEPCLCGALHAGPLLEYGGWFLPLKCKYEFIVVKFSVSSANQTAASTIGRFEGFGGSNLEPR